MKRLKLLLTFSFYLGAFSIMAQFNSVAIHLGGMNIQGEAASFDWSNPYDFSDIGIDAGFSFIKTLENEQWRIVVEGNYQTGNHMRNWGSEKNPSMLGSTFRSSSILLGGRYVLNSMVNRYHYYTGQVLPFIGFSLGASTTTAEVMGDKELLKNFTALQGADIALIGEGQIGAEMVVHENIRVYVMGAMRVSPSDYLDGIKGATAVGDFVYRGVVGVSYDFNN